MDCKNKLINFLWNVCLLMNGSYLVAVRSTASISPQSGNNQRHLSLNDVNAIPRRQRPLFVDFKHEESLLDCRIFMFNGCRRTYSLSMNFIHISLRRASGEYFKIIKNRSFATKFWGGHFGCGSADVTELHAGAKREKSGSS